MFFSIFVVSKLWQIFPVFETSFSNLYKRKEYLIFSQKHSQPHCENSPQKIITGLNHCSLVWVIIQTMKPPLPFLIRFLRKKLKLGPIWKLGPILPRTQLKIGGVFEVWQYWCCMNYKLLKLNPCLKLYNLDQDISKYVNLTPSKRKLIIIITWNL